MKCDVVRNTATPCTIVLMRTINSPLCTHMAAWIHICAIMYACIPVSLYLHSCMSAFKHVCMNMCACLHVHMHACIHVRIRYACMSVHLVLALAAVMASATPSSVRCSNSRIMRAYSCDLMLPAIIHTGRPMETAMKKGEGKRLRVWRVFTHCHHEVKQPQQPLPYHSVRRVVIDSCYATTNFHTTMGACIHTRTYKDIHMSAIHCEHNDSPCMHSFVHTRMLAL
jgi:hypothetical protein